MSFNRPTKTDMMADHGHILRDFPVMWSEGRAGRQLLKGRENTTTGTSTSAAPLSKWANGKGIQCQVHMVTIQVKQIPICELI